jgi:hypothetical protein
VIIHIKIEKECQLPLMSSGYTHILRFATAVGGTRLVVATYFQLMTNGDKQKSPLIPGIEIFA